MNSGTSFFVVILSATLFSADQTATTTDGRTVLLKSNGTWEYVSGTTTARKQDKPVTETTEGSLFDVIRNSGEYDFRSVQWGMSKKEVMATEDAAPIKNEPDALHYTMLLFGYQCSVEYRFTGGRLTDAVLGIRQEHIDPELFYKDYENLKQQLEPMFGRSVSNKCDWKNDMYRSQREKWGFAVSLGFLSCRTLWKTPRTTITLTIRGSNHAITTTMEYHGLLK
jgi:hypothetical protein